MRYTTRFTPKYTTWVDEETYIEKFLEDNLERIDEEIRQTVGIEDQIAYTNEEIVINLTYQWTQETAYRCNDVDAQDLIEIYKEKSDVYTFEEI